MSRSTITSKGQITVPKEIRDRFGLDRGDVLDFQVDADGTIRVRVVVENDLGLLRDFAPSTPVTVEGMKEAVRARAKKKAS